MIGKSWGGGGEGGGGKRKCHLQPYAFLTTAVFLLLMHLHAVCEGVHPLGKSLVNSVQLCDHVTHQYTHSLQHQ